MNLSSAKPFSSLGQSHYGKSICASEQEPDNPSLSPVCSGDLPSALWRGESDMATDWLGARAGTRWGRVDEVTGGFVRILHASGLPCALRSEP